MTATISAIYDNQQLASDAIEVLKSKGYPSTDFSVLASESSIDHNIRIEENTKAPEGTSIGAGIGAATGAALAGLTAVGTITLTGGVGLLAAGPIVAAFAGAGAGAVSGGVVGGLIGLGIPETEARIIDEKLNGGNVLVGVSVDDENKDKLQDLLKKTHAQKVTIH